MRVLHVVSGLDPRSGGVVSAVAGLTSAQQLEGLHVRVFSCFTKAYDDQSLAAALRQQAIEVRTVGPCRTPLMLHRELRPALSAMVNDADLVHIHAVWEQVQHVAAMLARAAASRTSLLLMGCWTPGASARALGASDSTCSGGCGADLQNASALHFTTAIERDLTHALRLTAPAIIEPNGLDLSEFEHLPLPGQFRSKYPQIGQRPIVLFLSRLHHKKGLELLVPAFASADSASVLVIAGPDQGGYESRIRQLVQQHGLGERVVFTGMLYGSDRIAAMVDASLFVLPSYQENFGIAVAEALAAGTPVLISDRVNIHPEVTAAGVGAVRP